MKEPQSNSRKESMVRSGRKLVRFEHPKDYGRFLKGVLPSFLLWNFLALGFLILFQKVIIVGFMNAPMLTEYKNLKSGPWEVFFSVFGIVYAIIVGMIIVEALGRYNNLRSLIEKEINAVKDIRDFLIYLKDDDNARPAIQDKLLELCRVSNT